MKEDTACLGLYGFARGWLLGRSRAFAVGGAGPPVRAPACPVSFFPQADCRGGTAGYRLPAGAPRSLSFVKPHGAAAEQIHLARGGCASSSALPPPRQIRSSRHSRSSLLPPTYTKTPHIFSYSAQADHPHTRRPVRALSALSGVTYRNICTSRQNGLRRLCRDPRGWS